MLGVYDQGSAAHIVTELTLADAATGAAMLSTTATVVVRGEGDFGGERRPSRDWDRPEGEPDLTISTALRADQGLLYRLSGDYNPLHSDPAFARRAGFDRPILHGLCTYGITSRLLINEICGGDADAVGRMEGRFTKPVMPGDTLTVDVWEQGAGFAFVVKDSANDIVLDRGRFALRDRARA